MLNLDVMPEDILKVYDGLLAIRSTYPLTKSERTLLGKMSGLLWTIHNEGRRPSDPDVAMPLLARANEPSEDDVALSRQATSLLMAEPSTHEIGKRLWLLKPDEAVGVIQGWRWLRAAEVILGPKHTDVQRGSWAYFVAIARGFKEADRERPVASRGRAPISDAAFDTLFGQEAV